jgi:putative membrane protein
MKAYFVGGLMLAAIASTAAQAETISPKEFVAKAGASDMFEIESARIVVDSKNPAISSFATRMITDHTKSTKMVKAAAHLDHVMVGRPSLTIGQRTNLTALKIAPGKTRDDLYVKQQKAAHDDALQLMQSYSQDGTARHLKMTAGKIAPVVQSHIEMLANM